MNQLGRPYAHYEQVTGKPFDHYRAFLSMVPYMVDMARQTADEDAHSWRNFHVGGAIYAINPATKEFDMTSAGNLKRRTNTKVCAEKKVVRRTEKNGLYQVIGLVVIGDTDPKAIAEVTGQETPTLHSCEDCQDQLDQQPSIMDHTLIVTSGLDSEINQAFTFGQLRHLYDPRTSQREKGALFNYNPDFENWQVRVGIYDHFIGNLEAPTDVVRANLARAAMTMTMPNVA